MVKTTERDISVETTLDVTKPLFDSCLQIGIYKAWAIRIEGWRSWKRTASHDQTVVSFRSNKDLESPSVNCKSWSILPNYSFALLLVDTNKFNVSYLKMQCIADPLKLCISTACANVTEAKLELHL